MEGNEPPCNYPTLTGWYNFLLSPQYTFICESRYVVALTTPSLFINILLPECGKCWVLGTEASQDPLSGNFLRVLLSLLSSRWSLRMKNFSFALPFRRYFLCGFARIPAPSFPQLRADRAWDRGACTGVTRIAHEAAVDSSRRDRHAVISNTCGERRRQRATPPIDRSCQRSPRSCPHTALHRGVKGSRTIGLLLRQANNSRVYKSKALGAKSIAVVTFTGDEYSLHAYVLAMTFAQFIREESPCFTP